MAQLFAAAIDAVECNEACIEPSRMQPLRERTLSRDGSDAVAALFDILADRSRVRILHLLSLEDDLCVGDMALVLGMSVSALSHQLRFLRDRNVVDRRKVGRVAYYRIIDDHVRHLIHDGVVHASERTHA